MASMMRSLDRFTDAEIPVEADEVATIRAYFSEWARELDERAS
ncbi:hypothetical protein AB0I28_30985 [Phytomonospora sp. NPDC050363]